MSLDAAIWGLVVADALGVPVEFNNRASLDENPVEDMRAYGTYNQPAGTWSDDSTMIFCLMEALAQDQFSLEDLSDRFRAWLRKAYWTPYNEVFDIGNATRAAIERLEQGVKPVLAGGMDEYSNGNGALMRILPLAFYTKNWSVEERFDCIKSVSSITHAHFRSIFACFFYIEYALCLMEGDSKLDALQRTQKKVADFAAQHEFNSTEIQHFDRILKGNIGEASRDSIKSSGYVVHSIEAAFWCLMNSQSYKETVLKAVNLGEDTDTTAAIVGGLAGLLYGLDQIPQKWINTLARKEDIADLINRLKKKL